MIVPAFFTTKVTSPAGTMAGLATRVMGPLMPEVSPSLTCTVVPLAALVDGTVVATAVVVVELDFELLLHPASKPSANAGTIPMMSSSPGRILSLSLGLSPHSDSMHGP
jgi:hypothetical protein